MTSNTRNPAIRMMDCDLDSDTDGGLQEKVHPPPSVTNGGKASGLHIDPRQLSSSNKEYCRKLEHLRRSQLCTMADLKLMNIKNLERRSIELVNAEHLLQRRRSSDGSKGDLKASFSAHELRSTKTNVEDPVCRAQVDRSTPNVSKYRPGSAKERIKNMWRDFRIDDNKTSSWRPEPPASPDQRQAPVPRTKKRVGWCPIVTVPEPFQMTLRESKCKAVRRRSQIEYEIEKLQRELRDLSECRRKFRAAPMPAHVRLPLYGELQARDEERRREFRAAERDRLLALQEPFSFLEREETKRQQRELKTLLAIQKHEKHMRRQFRARPVPRAVKEAAQGEREKEERLYRQIKKEMRATEMLLSAAQPPSMLAQRQRERRAAPEQPSGERYASQHASQRTLPDFDATYRSFQEQLASKKEFRPLTSCQPFQLRTANDGSRKSKPEADTRRQSASTGLLESPASSSGCSSVSASHEYLPTKITGAAKKRQEAVRKVLEQRKKAEQEKEEIKERQKRKEKKLQKLISTRAQAYDPHVSLAETCRPKLKEFRKQDLRRRREYEEELREMQQRVESRPLLLEQVTQTNAKWAAEKRFNATLQALGLNRVFISRNTSERVIQSGSENHTPLTYRKEQTAEHEDDVNSEDVEDVLIIKKNEGQWEDEGEKMDGEWDRNENGHSVGSYEDDLEFDDHVHADDDDDDDDDDDHEHDDDDNDDDHVHYDDDDDDDQNGDGEDDHEHDIEDGDDYHYHDDDDDDDQ